MIDTLDLPTIEARLTEIQLLLSLELSHRGQQGPVLPSGISQSLMEILALQHVEAELTCARHNLLPDQPAQPCARCRTPTRELRLIPKDWVESPKVFPLCRPCHKRVWQIFHRHEKSKGSQHYFSKYRTGISRVKERI